ncbi:hypothetical protein ASD45_14340 [Pseudolabrys sp. Root1462]|uniref:hypothetical protein n=1 Tax=Pseudolabrys sp. Root1462 TaxID=1736466 RepID=UPI000702859E|nr:hypothetical protein [Pseudolabrys sp. Root1462]KQZ01899.1 hypothetical protein ASD45_14340 [Pseudolabrys sp. Root1462]
MRIGIARYLTIIAVLVAALVGGSIGALEYIGIASGSIRLPAVAGKEQIRQPDTIVLPGDLRYWAAYKLPIIAAQNPEIVVVSSSRAGQMRSAMFKPYRLYNASFTSWNLEQMFQMVDRITRVSKPRTIIVEIDYFMFSDAYEKSVGEQRAMYFDNEWRFRYDSFFNFIRLMTSRPALLKNYVLPRLSGEEPAKLDGMRLIGIDAMATQAGFRVDGSYRYPTGLIASATDQTKNNRGLIESVPGAPHIDARQMAALERLAALARDRGVKLVAMQLPYLKASVEFLNNDPGYRPYAGLWREFESEAMSRKFEQLGIPFFDLCCVSFNDEASEFVDAIHVGERGMIQVLLTLAEDQRFRALFPDLEVERLKSDLDAARKSNNIFHVYGNRF